MLPQMHDLIHIEEIFVFCGVKEYHQTWTRNEIESVCEVIQPISFVGIQINNNFIVLRGQKIVKLMRITQNNLFRIIQIWLLLTTTLVQLLRDFPLILETTITSFLLSCMSQ